MDLVASNQLSLREALQLIEDWDVDIVTLLDLEKTSVPPTKRPRKNYTKIERLELLDEFERLQARLVTLEGNRVSSEYRANFLCQEWEAIASRQHEQRIASIIENDRLRAVLAYELKCARRAAMLVHRVDAIAQALGSDTLPSINGYNGPHVTISDQITRLDRLVIEAHELFSSTKFRDHDFRDVQVRTLDPYVLSIELQVSWLLPFDMTSVVNALWFHSTRMLRTEQKTSFNDLYAADGTLVSHFVAKTKNLGTIRSSVTQASGVSTHGQVATRLLPASDGAVVLVSDVEAYILQHSQRRSRIKGEAFLQITPLKTDQTHLCHAKWCRRIMISAPEDNASAVAEYMRWTNSFSSRAMHAKWWHSIETNLQVIENMLLTPVQS